MKRFFLALLLATLLCSVAFASETPSASVNATIRSLTGTYTFAEDGSCTVQLDAEMEFSAGVREFALPVPAEARELYCSSGGYTTERNGDTLLIRLQSPTQLADQTVQIAYRLSETVTAGEGGQTCVLQLLQADRACPVTSYQATITLPAAFDSLPLFESFYYQDRIDNYLDIAISDGVITLRSLQPLRDHEPLRMTLELPTGFFDLRFLAGKTATLDTILFWFFLVAGLAFWAVFLRNRILLPKPVAMPPMSGNAGSVPYLTTGAAPDLALMVLHWASLGYLTVTCGRRGGLRLEKQIDMDSERKGYEVQIFRSLFGRGDTLLAPSDTFRMARENAPAIAAGHWEQRIFSPHRGYPKVLRAFGALCGAAVTLMSFDRLIPAQSWRWFAIAPATALGALACWLLQTVAWSFLRRRQERTLLLAVPSLLYLLLSFQLAKVGPLGLLCIVYQLAVGLLLLLGGKRSRGGMRQAEALLGLRRFLLRSKPAELRAVQAEDPQYFYRTLVYADALRVGGSFAKKFGRVPMEPCTWLTAEHGAVRSAEAFYTLYQRAVDAMREQTDAPLWNLLKNLHRKKS